MNDDLSLIYGRYFEELFRSFSDIQNNFRDDNFSNDSFFPSEVTDFFESLTLPGLEPQPQPQPEPMPGYGYGYDYGYGYGYYGGGEVVVETKPRICTKDMFRCPDGSLVSRDENCNFRPCPQPQPQPQESYGYGGEEVVVSTPVVSEPRPTSIVLEINPKDASVSSSPRYFQMIVLKEQFPQIYFEWNKLPIKKVGLNPNNTRNQIYTMDFSPDVASLVYIIQQMINESPFIPYTAEVAYL